jgi:hypothetical protein
MGKSTEHYLKVDPAHSWSNDLVSGWGLAMDESWPAERRHAPASGERESGDRGRTAADRREVAAT